MDELKNSLKKLDQKIEFLSRAYTHLHNDLVKRKIEPAVEEAVKNFLRYLNETCRSLNILLCDTSEQIRSLLSKETAFREEIKGTLKFIAKSQYETEKRLSKIESDYEKRIKIKFFVDEENAKQLEKDHTKLSPVLALDQLLNHLTKREQYVLIHRLGLKGEKVKTYQKISDGLGIKSRESTSRIFNKAIRRCRLIAKHNKNLIDSINCPALEKLVIY